MIYSICSVNCGHNFDICCFKAVALHQEETEASFVFIIKILILLFLWDLWEPLTKYVNIIVANKLLCVQSAVEMLILMLISLVCNAYALVYFFAVNLFSLLSVAKQRTSRASLIDFVDVFEPFLKAYVNEFKYKSITTDDWKQFLYKFFDDKVICSMFAYIFIY